MIKLRAEARENSSEGKFDAFKANLHPVIQKTIIVDPEVRSDVRRAQEIVDLFAQVNLERREREKDSNKSPF